MKTLIVIAAILLISCSKKINHQPIIDPGQNYKNLGDFELDYNHPLQLDVNNDGTTDYAFAVQAHSEYLIDKLLFRGYTLNGSEYLLNDLTPKAFDKGETIFATDGSTLKWTRNNAFLVNRIYTDNPAKPEWEGAWKDKTDKYLPIKIKARDGYHLGWIRMSIGGLQSKIIVHDYAFAKTADTELKAGDVIR